MGDVVVRPVPKTEQRRGVDGLRWVEPQPTLHEDGRPRKLDDNREPIEGLDFE